MLKRAMIPALVFLVIIVGLLIYGISRDEDQGFIVDQCVREEPKVDEVHWEKGATPLVPIINFETLSPSWIETFGHATARWNHEVGKPMFTELIPLGWDTQSPCHQMPSIGSVVFITGIEGNGISENIEEMNHTRIFWDKDCVIRCVEIRIPRDTNHDLWSKVAAHELGHALGLQHDATWKSLMYPGGDALWFGMDQITEEDLDLIRDTY